jgi:hypothetical protein
MGVFKNMRDLQKQARDIERSMPPAGERMAAAQARMANLNQMMAAQTQAASAAASGAAERRSVTITGMRQTGMMNFQPIVEFDLTVLPDDRPPYPVTISQPVSPMQIGQLRAGLTLEASVDPANPSAVWLDLTQLG